jgi:hypothetical protein
MSLSVRGAIRALADNILQRQEFSHIDDGAKAAIAQRLMQVSDPTDPRNLMTLLLFHMAAMSEECMSPSLTAPLRDSLNSIARDPAFRRFSHFLVPDDGSVGILNARSGLELAKDEIAAVRDLLGEVSNEAT